MNNQGSPERSSMSAALWASAFVLFAMIITQAGRITNGPSTALAGIESSVGDLTVLTAFGEANQDVLLVLDRRAERVSVYGIDSRGGLQIYESYQLPDVFLSARVAAGSSARP